MDPKSQSIEFEGSTLDEAINKAVLEMGVPKNQLDIKVVCEEKLGLFGMQGAKKAKIIVRIK